MNGTRRIARALTAILALALAGAAYAEGAIPAQSGEAFGTVGETVLFGWYEQDADIGNGPEPIEWTVLDAKDGKSLLLSRYALDVKPYYDFWDRGMPCGWEKSTLREWLNGPFFETAFGDVSGAYVLTAETGNSGEYDGPDTEDRVFLLSREEGGRYLGEENEAWMALPTAFARSRGARVAIAVNWRNPLDRYDWLGGPEGYGKWWLRSCTSAESAYSVQSTGYHDNVDHFDDRYVGVRPAVWIDTACASADGERMPETFSVPEEVPWAPDPAAHALGRDAAVGDVVLFGACEQDNVETDGKEPIEWIVLDRQGDDALLVSRLALDACRLQNRYEPTSWETCTLRAWLNGVLLDRMFGAEEQAALLPCGIAPTEGTDPAYADTAEDLVFLLSADEAERCFDSDEARACRPTAVTNAHGADTIYQYPEFGITVDWWTRSLEPDWKMAGATSVWGNGHVDTEWGTNVAVVNGIRPAVRVDLANLLFD